MTELPILFSAPMVRALLAGTKTQTRRALKSQPPEDHSRLVCGPYSPTVIDRHGEEQPGAEVFGVTTDDGDWGLRCPYGGPGDRLWVRETWATRQGCEAGSDKAKHYTMYRASGGDPADPMNWHDYGGKWRSPIFMPRWASRLTIEVVGVRVERVQDISETDAIAEGVTKIDPAAWVGTKGNFYSDPRLAYRDLYESINGAGSWDKNPYVWVVEFRRIGA